MQTQAYLLLCSTTQHAGNPPVGGSKLNSRPQFARRGVGAPAAKYPLEYFFRSHKVAGFFNSAPDKHLANVEAVMVAGTFGRCVQCRYPVYHCICVPDAPHWTRVHLPSLMILFLILHSRSVPGFLCKEHCCAAAGDAAAAAARACSWCCLRLRRRAILPLKRL